MVIVVVYQKSFIENYLSKIVHQESSIKSCSSKIIYQESLIGIIFLKKLFEMESADPNDCLN